MSTPHLRFLTDRLSVHRAAVGTRWRQLSAGRQALQVLAHLRLGHTYAQLAAGFEVGVSTVFRYITEAVGLLAALAPGLATAVTAASAKAFVILGGTLLPIDRIAADRPYYSGKHKKPGMNVQVIADPHAKLLWASALHGAVHDIKAARTHGIIEAFTEAGLACWADKGYQGAGGAIRVPYRGRCPSTRPRTSTVTGSSATPGHSGRRDRKRKEDARADHVRFRPTLSERVQPTGRTAASEAQCGWPVVGGHSNDHHRHRWHAGEKEHPTVQLVAVRCHAAAARPPPAATLDEPGDTPAHSEPHHDAGRDPPPARLVERPISRRAPRARPRPPPVSQHGVIVGARARSGAPDSRRSNSLRKPQSPGDAEAKGSCGCSRDSSAAAASVSALASAAKVTLQAEDASGAEWCSPSQLGDPALRARVLSVLGRPREDRPAKDDPYGTLVVITNEAGEVLMHLRDEKEGIWAPGTWAPMGGGTRTDSAGGPGDRAAGAIRAEHPRARGRARRAVAGRAAGHRRTASRPR
ncbi:transposase family protein [Streptomyces scopuliridis]|uniref:transposase family protein n=1 Tax=Streptomyces scopuliridis TaxID=452529 RepID=UPI0036AEDC38